MATDPTNILIGSGVAYLSEAKTNADVVVSITTSNVVELTTYAGANDILNGSLLEITSGVGKGQFRHIWDWVQADKDAFIEPDLTTDPAALDTTATWEFTAVDGGFKDDLSIEFSEEATDIEIADAMVHVKGKRTMLNCFIRFSLVEATLENLRKGLGLPTANNAAGGSTNNILFITDEAGGESGFVALKFVGNNSDGEFKTWFFPKCRMMADLSMAYNKDNEILIPCAAKVYGWPDGDDWGLAFAIDA